MHQQQFPLKCAAHIALLWVSRTAHQCHRLAHLKTQAALWGNNAWLSSAIACPYNDTCRLGYTPAPIAHS